MIIEWQSAKYPQENRYIETGFVLNHSYVLPVITVSPDNAARVVLSASFSKISQDGIIPGVVMDVRSGKTAR